MTTDQVKPIATFVRSLETHDAPLTTDRSQQLWKVGDHYVVTSAVAVMGVPETYVFRANSEGLITDWTEQDGSFRGSLNHKEAIDGYVASLGGGQ